jgi:hypothetical protein
MVFAGRGRVEEWLVSRSRNAQNYIQNLMVSKNNGRKREWSFTRGGHFKMFYCIIMYHPDSDYCQNSINDVCWPEQVV